MRLLLDTHVALWAIAASPRLSRAARDAITDPDNEIHVSAASVWEIAIKHALKRKGAGAMPVSGRDALGYFEAAGYVLVAVKPVHAAAVEALPHHHGDPFDRLLIAQAREEPLRFMTHDATLQRYDSSILIV